MKLFGMVAGILVLGGATLQAQTYNVIHSFATSDGEQPRNLVVSGNALYGTTPEGGGNDQGTMFTVNTDGSGFSQLDVPQSIDGGFGSGTGRPGLLLIGNVLYGVSGANVLVNWLGETNYSILPMAMDGSAFNSLLWSGFKLYGTTGSSVFSLNTDGTGFKTLRTFTGSPDGADSQAGLVLGGYTLYGTTYRGGTNYNGLGGTGNGTVFKINIDGTGYALLHSFTNAPDGANPQADLLLNGSQLYGTTANGGSAGYGTVFMINTDGTGYAVLRNFTNSPDGANPEAGLALVDGALYGTTCYGGTIQNSLDGTGNGTVFEINTNGSGYAVVHNFLGAPNDGAYPLGKLVVGSDGLYGTTSRGSATTNQDNGTIFRLTLPPPPLQVTAPAGSSPVVFWPNDGFNHILQTTTNLNSGPWTTVSNGAPLVGLQATNVMGQPQAFFRLQ
jgi:uncharacterized repeat protein (TIGR03803 family)